MWHWQLEFITNEHGQRMIAITSPVTDEPVLLLLPDELDKAWQIVRWKNDTVNRAIQMERRAALLAA